MTGSSARRRPGRASLLTRGLLKPADVQRIVDLLENDGRFRDPLPAGSVSLDDVLLGRIVLE